MDIASLADAIATAVAGPARQGLAGLDAAQVLALAAAMGWASGLRLYLVVFLVGLAGATGWMPLPVGLQVLSQPLVIGAAGLMAFIEFFADKIPGLDTLWDAVHTVIRIPAGAALAASMFGGLGGTDAQVWTVIAALLGGTLAATAHAAKATTRAAVNTSPEPFSNISLSLLGDALVPTMLWLAYAHPLMFFIVLALLLLAMIALTLLLLRFLRALVRRFSSRAPLRFDDLSPPSR